MGWIERLNCAVEYMEAHMLEKTDYGKVVETAIFHGRYVYGWQQRIRHLTIIRGSGESTWLMI